ncbi:hypothetical protein [Kitasatospora sp. NPDC087314]|uniref:hypothetical protein n=1 Tax=Kitasatospora sp. NPDC087314 TaxID=3364068 RepID=UPI0037F760E8
MAIDGPSARLRGALEEYKSRRFHFRTPIEPADLEYLFVEPDENAVATTPEAAADPSRIMAAAAYRNMPVERILDAFPGSRLRRRPALLAQNFAEAYSDALIRRALDHTDHPQVQAFGTNPVPVIEHCLQARARRRSRDRKLALVALALLPFAPGAAAWYAALRVKATLPARQAVRTVPIALILGLAMWLTVTPPGLPTPWNWYIPLALLAPVLCWPIATDIALRHAEADLITARDLLYGPVPPSALVPEAVPTGPRDIKAKRLRDALALVAAQQESNIFFYDDAGVTGAGQRWASWHLDQPLNGERVSAAQDFHPWTVVAAVRARLTEQPPVPGTVAVDDWALYPLRARSENRPWPIGPDMDGLRMRPSALQRICNTADPHGPRHALALQLHLFEGRAVLTFLVRVQIRRSHLLVDIDAYALGTLSAVLQESPKSHWAQANPLSTMRESETRVDLGELTRLLVRAPRACWSTTPVRGQVQLPEPFGLRHSSAQPPMATQEMADVCIYMATPVMHAIQSVVETILDGENLAASGQEHDGFKAQFEHVPRSSSTR